jgi:hypothetical protein
VEEHRLRCVRKSAAGIMERIQEVKDGYNK